MFFFDQSDHITHGADSLDTVELMLDFEKKFGIAIPDDQQENIVTVGDVIRLIEEEQKKNA